MIHNCSVELPAGVPGSVPRVHAKSARVKVSGKFLTAGTSKLHVCGTTYGPFRPLPDGSEYGTPAQVGRDFAQMAANHINAVRVYTVPPAWLLDEAHAQGMRVMVGLPWEQHITFLEDAKRARDIERRVREGVRACAGHPAVMCYAIGNEIPASIVRWYGRRRVEQFLRRLYLGAKEEDPEALITYVNYPTTEYIQLGFLDFSCFNVYLEDREKLEAYLGRLQNLAGDRPLVIAEAGLDSRRNGRAAQAQALEWQIRAAFAKGCAGLFVYSWTDEWYRGGQEIEDWDFGMVTRGREPKPALAAVGRAFAAAPFGEYGGWPRISVVVCTYNGSRTIAATLAHLEKLDYPDYEVIVVNDGSTDGAAEIVRRFPAVRLINQPNQGLSAARNAGMRAAGGEIIAYLDDDAYPDPHWLRYLAYAFRNPRHAAVGGPNVPPPDDGVVATCVANAPGGPAHVLLSDEVAEHIPGCNFAVRKACLEAIGGFNPTYRVAGDDVDVCWRLQNAGWTLGFHPAALVWHHRRNSVRAYWKQQRGYGRAEALLEKRWPEKYNVLGHVRWDGRMYGAGLPRGIGRRWRIYYGTWGTAPFQSLYEPGSGGFQSFLQTPEWHLMVLALTILSAAGLFWPPLLAAAPLLALTVLLALAQAIAGASQAHFRTGSIFRRGGMYALTTALYLVQPIARLRGRLDFGLTPWRGVSNPAYKLPRRFTMAMWSEHWQSPQDWLASFEASISDRLPWVFRGGDFDCWDLHIRGGMFMGLRMRMAVEEHGAGKQLLRFSGRPAPQWGAVLCVAAIGSLAAFAAMDGAIVIAILLAALWVLLADRILLEWGVARTCLVRAVEEMQAEVASRPGGVAAAVRAGVE